jgi:hypothetical protein
MLRHLEVGWKNGDQEGDQSKTRDPPSPLQPNAEATGDLTDAADLHEQSVSRQPLRNDARVEGRVSEVIRAGGYEEPAEQDDRNIGSRIRSPNGATSYHRTAKSAER